MTKIRAPIIAHDDFPAFLGLFPCDEHRTRREWEELFRGWETDKLDQGYEPEWRVLRPKDYEAYLRRGDGVPLRPCINSLIDFLAQLP